MADPLQTKSSAGGDETTLPAGLIAVGVLAFVAGVSATAYFCRSMAGGMGMPGGWTMSMMWMRMPGQSWTISAAMFLLMWLAMMVAMMLPSALPAFLRFNRGIIEPDVRDSSLPPVLVATGYFAVWMLAGAAVYFSGVAFMSAAMRWDGFSRLVPMLSGVALIVAGAIEVTPWKLSRLLRCRNPVGCSPSSDACRAGWYNGLRQGISCFMCCFPVVIAQLALGIMNPLVMAGVAAVITVEKLAPGPERIVRVVGALSIVAGLGILVRAFS